MIPKHLFDSIDADDIENLQENAVREGRTLEYKRALPSGTDSDKKEFLADICAFANTAGGDLVFGVVEADGVPTSLPGLIDFREDEVRLRLESAIRDGIEPRLPAIQIKAVSGFERGPVLVLRVPKSWSLPHMVTYKSRSRFFSRHSAGKSPMDWGEIRDAFAAAAELPHRIRQWRDERLGRILDNQGPVPLTATSCLVVHLIPFESFGNEWRFDAAQLSGSETAFPPPGPVGYDGPHFNLDGVLTVSFGSRNAAANRYTQAFRSGRIEAVCADILRESDGTRRIALGWCERMLLETIPRYVASLKGLGVQTPTVFFLSIVGARGALRELDPGGSDRDCLGIDRDVLSFPEVLIEDYGTDLPRIFRPVFDALWNACGVRCCPSYDAKGDWHRAS